MWHFQQSYGTETVNNRLIKNRTRIDWCSTPASTYGTSLGGFGVVLIAEAGLSSSLIGKVN